MEAAPPPEMLQPQSDKGSDQPESDAAKAPQGNSAQAAAARRFKRNSYRPGHKGTFVGLAVVIVLMAAIAGVIVFVLKSQSKKEEKQLTQGQVTISQDALDKLGVNRGSGGNSGIELVVNPDARFAGKVQVAGDVNVSGELKLNSKFSAQEASLAQLSAGNTSVDELNVNGNSTISTLNLRNDLLVTGQTRLQGTVTITSLTTVNNSLNVTGNMSVGGTLTVNNAHTSNITIDGTTTLGGHVITRGSAPSVSAGSAALGSNGTVGISGNDTAGTISVNIGVGAGTGLLASMSFRTPYTNIPKVVATVNGGPAGNYYLIRNASGFSVFASSAFPPGGYTFDYIVMQ